MAEESGGRMPFWSHIAELRRRVLISVAAVLMGFGIAYHYSEGIFRFLVLPFSDAYLKVYGKAPIMITTGLVESFWVYMKVGLLAGVFLASPVILWEIWGLVSGR